MNLVEVIEDFDLDYSGPPISTYQEEYTNICKIDTLSFEIFYFDDECQCI